MSRTTDLTGKRFGKLTVIRNTGEQQQRYWTWLCRCDCGNEIAVSTKRLNRGTVTHCGCESRTKECLGPIPDDLTGKRYGKLTVLRSAQQTGTQRQSWLCRCDCGNECCVTAYMLHNGLRKSCGCLQKKAETDGAVNLTGQTFGVLNVICRGKRRDAEGAVMWKCSCGCGAEIEVSEEALLQGKCRSCGCKTDERERAAEADREITEPRKSRSDNTSGFRGVSRHPDGRWMVSIGLKSKRYYIGLFPDFEEAVRARKRMEEILQRGFAEAYENWQVQAQEDRAWAEEHPFYYDVAKNGQYFQIQTVFGSTTVSAV